MEKTYCWQLQIYIKNYISSGPRLSLFDGKLRKRWYNNWCIQYLYRKAHSVNRILWPLPQKFGSKSWSIKTLVFQGIWIPSLEDLINNRDDLKLSATDIDFVGSFLPMLLTNSYQCWFKWKALSSHTNWTSTDGSSIHITWLHRQ